ncbi:hypothetical protein IV203_027259 [Nitzschia inconspicua]|uniref:Uncharacterized protein n=1 Tax=Nitzschia inconspicua TaxID=303405 RepID=A0A9K3LWT8_9STRA|nr:hypothetical protein IV203_027259 [Nitzschia inconspicua]
MVSGLDLSVNLIYPRSDIAVLSATRYFQHSGWVIKKHNLSGWTRDMHYAIYNTAIACTSTGTISSGVMIHRMWILVTLYAAPWLEASDSLSFRFDTNSSRLHDADTREDQQQINRAAPFCLDIFSLPRPHLVTLNLSLDPTVTGLFKCRH